MEDNYQNIDSEVLSLKDLILTLEKYVRYLIKNWLFICIAGIVGLGIGAYIVLTSPEEYIATQTFMVQEDEGGGGLSGITSTLASFGFGGVSSGKYNYDKVVAIANSKRVIFSGLLDTMINSNQIIANKFIDLYDVKIIDSTGEEKKIYFDSGMNYLKIEGEEVALLNKLYSILHNSDSPTFTIDYGSKSKIITAQVKSKDENFSYSLLKCIYDHLNAFYTSQATEKFRENTHILKIRLDSTKNILVSKEAVFAREKDKDLGTYLFADKLTQGNLMRDIQIASTVYAEILKNYESSRYLMQSMRPMFTIVDAVFLPIPKISKSRIITPLLFSVGLSVLAILYFIFRKIIQDAFSE